MDDQRARHLKSYPDLHRTDADESDLLAKSRSSRPSFSSIACGDHELLTGLVVSDHLDTQLRD
jgi:hypothetical protein